jgi:hypothetical protein
VGDGRIGDEGRLSGTLPPVSKPLEAMYAKLDRADESLRTLDQDLAQFSMSEPIGVGFNLNFQTGWHTAYVAYHKNMPPRFAVLVGESLYHARSVLEHLVWAMVQANHHTPARAHTFPLWDMPQQLRGATGTREVFIELTTRKQLAGVPTEAIGMIEDIQPYHLPNPTKSGLSILNRMARTDRHHAIHGSFVGGRGVSDMERRFTTPPGVHMTVFERLLSDGEPIVPGTHLARFRVDRYGRRSEVRMRTGVPVFIAFGDPESGQVYMGEFLAINTYVRQLIGHFEKFL